MTSRRRRARGRQRALAGLAAASLAGGSLFARTLEQGEPVSQTNVRAARGAIRVTADTSEAVLGATERLLGTMLERNAVTDPGDLVSVFFTVTEDLRSAFPAEAARRMGLGSVPLMCAQEIPVAGAMPSVVRILMHFHTGRAQSEVEHAYLDGAESLRDDLG